MKRKICVITGSRADYGILKPLLLEIKDDESMILQIVATGMHLSSEFGLTYREIERDKFKISEKIETLLSSDTPVAVAKSMGLTLSGFAETYRRLKPDIVVGLGDRFELLSAVIAAHVMRIPIAHIGGGEVTEGAIDEAFRHAITKMSHLHFASTEEYRRRIIQLGEEPQRVFCFGEIGLDRINSLSRLSREEVASKLKIKFHKFNLLVTFHPATLDSDVNGRQFQNLLDVLGGLKDTHIFFTKANADAYGRVINGMIENFVSRNSGFADIFSSLGSDYYLSLMRHMDAVVGNSSSGIVEAPSLHVGTVNIGDRQKGRARATSVIDCEPTRQSIQKALRKLYSVSFQRNLRCIGTPYKNKKAPHRIKEVLKRYPLNRIIKKRFYNMEIFRKGACDGRKT